MKKGDPKKTTARANVNDPREESKGGSLKPRAPPQIKFPDIDGILDH